MSKNIFVLDDEPDILELISIHLRKANFRVKTFAEADTFLRALRAECPDLIILDLMLPDADGMDICRHIKNNPKLNSIPIIMLTAKTDETDRILGLELGADDYVTKPFSPRELVARVKAVLRRKTEQGEAKTIKIGDAIVIDPQRFTFEIEGKPIDLTSTEFKILEMLAERKGWVFTREQILNALWGQDKAVIDRTVDVHIKHIRDKLGKHGRFIRNVRGVGYKIEE